MIPVYCRESAQFDQKWTIEFDLLLFLLIISHPSSLISSPLCPVSASLTRVLTWPGADLVVVQVDVISAGYRRVLSLLLALVALLLLHLPLLWGHKSTGSPPGLLDLHRQQTSRPTHSDCYQHHQHVAYQTCHHLRGGGLKLIFSWQNIINHNKLQFTSMSIQTWTCSNSSVTWFTRNFLKLVGNKTSRLDAAAKRPQILHRKLLTHVQHSFKDGQD